MIFGHPNIDLSIFYDNMRGVRRLADVAKIITGYYSMYSRVLSLKNCQTDGHYVQGFSELLQKNIAIERGAVSPLLLTGRIKDFADVDSMHYSIYVLTADHLSDQFHNLYPFAAEYLDRCMMEKDGRDVAFGRALIRPKLREEIDKKKVIVSLKGDICHAVLDSETHVLPMSNAYLCSFPNEDFDTYKAYLALINSQVFSFLYYHEINNEYRYEISRSGTLEDMPVPDKSEAFLILENIADCLLYISCPGIPELSHRISNERIKYYLAKIMDMAVYEMYFPSYMHARNLNVIDYMHNAPFMYTMMDIRARIYETYIWFQQPENMIRQKMELLDTRSPELLLKIQNFNPHE